MNLTDKPELMDHLAAAYALGTLRGGARRRFETLARLSPTLRASAMVWQERLASMTELQAAEVPGPNVWKRIENLIRAQPAPGAALVADAGVLDGLLRALRLWRGAALTGGLAAVVAVVVGVNLNATVEARDGQLTQLTRNNEQLAAELRAAPQVQYVAVLSDDQSGASMVVTFDPKHQRLVLRRAGGYQEAADKSLQLWALPPAGGPKSLGVLGEGPVVQLTAAEGQVRDVPALAISLEPKGGVQGEGGPTGPVLFKGAFLQTGT